MTDEATSELLRPGEVARLFRVHPKTVMKWARDGKLHAVKTLGGHARFVRSEVLQVMAELGIPGSPPP